MELKIVDESYKNAWQEYVYNNPFSVPGQCYDWIDILNKHYKLKFYPFAVFNGKRIVGILPLYEINNLLISSPYAVNGGILADNIEIEKILLDEAIEFSKKQNINKFLLRQYKKRIAGELYIDENYYNKELDLTQKTDDIFKGFDEKNKSILSDNDLNSYQLEMCSTDIDTFYKILFNFHQKSGLPCVSKKWVIDLCKLNIYDIAILKKANKIVAATMIKRFVKAVSFPLSCSINLNKVSMANMHVLYWMLIKRFKDMGFTIFHSGRIPRTNDTYVYRLGWGGKEYEYPYHYYPKISVKTDYSKKRGLKREIFKTVWRITPKFITRRIGTKIVSKFP